MSKTPTDTATTETARPSLHNDYINRFLFDNTDIRGEVVALEHTFQQAIAHQHLPKKLIPLFGEFLAAASLLAEVLKFEGILTLQARGNGKIGLIMAETTHKGELRGVVRLNPNHTEEVDWDGDLDLSLPALLGEATLAITVEPNIGARYQGIVPLEEATLAACLQHYFEQSEQLPTHVKLFADQHYAGGIFLQCLPAQLITDLQKRRDTWETCCHLAETITREELFSLANEEILLRLFHEMTCRVFEAKNLHFKCSCDRERGANALKSIGQDEAMELLSKHNPIKIDCQFCGQVYQFGQRDLEELFLGEPPVLH